MQESSDFKILSFPSAIPLKRTPVGSGRRSWYAAADFDSRKGETP
jgi:hypothetical protein